MRRIRFTAIPNITLLVIFSTVWSIVAQDHSHPEPDTDSSEEMVQHGEELFTLKGCVACHGEGAMGTDIAPALAGHSAFSVRRQVRAPVGIMPTSSPEQISNEELEALVAYITSLEMMDMGEDSAHAHEGVATGDIVFAHHWMAWLAFESEDSAEALHQTAHTIIYLNGIHLTQMQEVLISLAARDWDTARIIVEPMVTGVGEFNNDPNTIALQMAYKAVVVEDAETARHFLAHYNEVVDTEFSAEILHLVEEDELHEVALLLEAHLGDDISFGDDMMSADIGHDTHETDADDDTSEGHQHD